MHISCIQNNKEKAFFCVFGIIFGILFFIGVYGIEVINPRYYEWIISNGGDSSITFWGGLFFQKSDWSLSNFGINDLTYPYNCSLIFFDGIIPLAYFFKLVYLLLFNDYTILQFIGVHSLICCGLQGLFSALIVLKISKNKVLRIVGIVLLTDTNILMARLFVHNSLAAQYIILAAIVIYLYKLQLGNKRYVLYGLLTGFSTIMHLYFTLMLAFLIFLDLLEDGITDKKWKKSILAYLSIFSFAAIVLWFFGGFQTEVASAPCGGKEELFKYHSNILTLFDPGTSSIFLRDLPEGNFQYEGYGYLGFGVIILLAIEAIVLLLFRIKRIFGEKQIEYFYPLNKKTVILAIVLSFVIAVGPHVMLGNHVLLDIPVPSIVHPFFYTFKSLGRFVWITCYVLICCSIWLAQVLIDSIVSYRRVSFLIIIFIGLIQIVDLWPMYNAHYDKFARHESWESIMVSSQWDKLAEEKEHIILITNDIVYSQESLCNSMMLFAYKNDLKMSATKIAHSSNMIHEKSLAWLDEIKNGKIDNKAIYWFQSQELMDMARDKMHTEIIDGYYVGWN